MEIAHKEEPAGEGKKQEEKQPSHVRKLLEKMHLKEIGKPKSVGQALDWMKRDAESGKLEKIADGSMREHQKLLAKKFKRREEFFMTAEKYPKGMAEIKCWQKNCRKKARIRRSKRFKKG
ncbi:MAG: hypothetical protein Sv326_0509 [Candidatus Fermentimicrarchaeum limneticum]|uniref:Uncharacterized protein n=1 Tax=Fermentimicrarchaeum limneticum TaxID=2795018 RepID=A0A7D6BUU0_FERL1|nr:MAG: hypothetical protein Sv326_0509 [Candidatus Fermentimicrarchaeum limneticum]